MSCYRRLYYNSSCFRLFLILLVVLFYILQSRVNAQNTYDVNITNHDVNVIISNATDAFNSALDTSQIDANVDSTLHYNGISPMDWQIDGVGSAPKHQGYSDFNANFSVTAPSNSYDRLKPSTSGRNPMGLTGKYFKCGFPNWLIGSRASGYTLDTPLDQHESTNVNSYNMTASEMRVTPTSGTHTTFFNYTQFRNDIIAAIIGSDGFNFFVRLMQSLASAPSVANFTFTVPPTFGFNSGLQINIPFSDILHGSGSWSSFSQVISFFRSLMAFTYYFALSVIIVRCVFRYQ